MRSNNFDVNVPFTMWEHVEAQVNNWEKSPLYKQIPKIPSRS